MPTVTPDLGQPDYVEIVSTSQATMTATGQGKTGLSSIPVLNTSGAIYEGSAISGDDIYAISYHYVAAGSGKLTHQPGLGGDPETLETFTVDGSFDSPNDARS